MEGDKDRKKKPYNEALLPVVAKFGCPTAEPRAAMWKAWQAGIWLWEPDQIHLNMDGNRVVARTVLDAFGYRDVLLPAAMKIEVLPGLVTPWKVKAAPKDAAPLDEKTVLQVKPDDSWKTVSLPETEPQAEWWPDQVRQEGYCMSLQKWLGEASRYLGVATVHADKARTACLNTGGHLSTVWLNGKRVFKFTGEWNGYHIGTERIPVELQEGDNTLIIETGQQFALTITDKLLW